MSNRAGRTALAGQSSGQAHGKSGSGRGAGKPSPRPSLRAWVRILAVHKHGLAVIGDDLVPTLTVPRFDLLANLQRQDGQTSASLSRHMRVSAGNLTGLVDRAVRDGLVERRAHPRDRRAWRVHLLPAGRRLFAAAERRHARRVEALFSSLSPAELAKLAALLDKVRT